MNRVCLRMSFLLVVLTFLLACAGPVEKSSAPEKVPKGLSAMEYLDRFNGPNYLYRGTPTHLRLAKKPHIPYSYKNLPHLRREPRLKEKPDSIRYEMDGDSVHIYRFFYARGSCLNLFPYIKTVPRTNILMDPELVVGDIDVLNGDTTVVMESCALETVVEFHFTLPTSALPLRYRHHLIARPKD